MILVRREISADTRMSQKRKLIALVPFSMPLCMPERAIRRCSPVVHFYFTRTGWDTHPWRDRRT